MRLPDLALGPEWAVLELLCLGLTTPQEQDMFEDILRSGDLHWGELLEQALRHKILPLLAFHALHAQGSEAIPRQIESHLRLILNLNRHKLKILRNEAAKIVKALAEQGVRCVGRKGIVFESTLYKGNGSRQLSDIDFLVASKEEETVTVALSGLGYRVGKFDWEANRVIAHRRAEMLIYRLSPDHIPAFILLISDPVVRFVSVDFATSMTWAGSTFDVPVETALQEIAYQPIPEIPDIEMPCLSPEFQFIDTVVHLFREAWFERWLEREQDVDLMKFGDVVRLWKANQNILQGKKLKQTLEECDLIDPVVWVLEHLDRTLHIGIVSSLDLGGRVAESWLASARKHGGQLRFWRGTMRERLHCKDRLKLFVATPVVD